MRSHTLGNAASGAVDVNLGGNDPGAGAEATIGNVGVGVDLNLPTPILTNNPPPDGPLPNDPSDPAGPQPDPNGIENALRDLEPEDVAELKINCEAILGNPGAFSAIAVAVCKVAMADIQ